MSDVSSPYRVYVDTILAPLRPWSLSAVRLQYGASVDGRVLLEDALSKFVAQLRGYVTGCDDRKLSKGTLRRARGIEEQLTVECETALATLLRSKQLVPNDLHAIWHGFSVVRGWREVRVPQACLVEMLRGALAELDADQVDEWANQALTWELTLPEVHQSISVGAWPVLCELLGRLPDCVTPAEIQEALWQQSFVENPTHAPDHRNYRRFAALAAQMVAIGVELEPDKVQLLVKQTLELDRPWRERRDMLSGILSAASVYDRNQVVRLLDRRFEEHNDIDDFEIVCGIAEIVGVEIPRDGAIRRCAMRRWALDEKRGGALPVSQLIDFVDGDAAIGEDVALSLRQKGRTADAAVLLARLPRDAGPCTAVERAAGLLDISSGDAELGRLREILAMDDDNLAGKGVFGPVEEGAFRVPLERYETVCLAETAVEAEAAVTRLQGAPLVSINYWVETAPFWHSPITLLAFCTDRRAELFDLTSLRNDSTGGWPEAANKIRSILSDPQTLKVVYCDDILQILAYTLGLGVANTLKRGEKEPLGPSLDLGRLMGDLMCCDKGCKQRGTNEIPWHTIATLFLGGLRVCGEERGCNWSRRPLRESQVHYAVAEAWSVLPVIRAVCSYGLVSKELLWRYVCPQEKPCGQAIRAKLGKGHTIGQLAPQVVSVASVTAVAATLEKKGRPEGEDMDLSRIKRVAALAQDVPLVADVKAGLTALSLEKGTLVAVFEERFGGLALVTRLDHLDAMKPPFLHGIPKSSLRAANAWSSCPTWVSSLPRLKESTAEAAPTTTSTPTQKELKGDSKKLAATKLDPTRVTNARHLLEGLFDKLEAEDLFDMIYTYV